ncbi:MAG TPA: hypothetical protein VND91_10585 [Candidatus Saccharimonadia bacterium]|nr:hypothetical protein [Candidatus Saccharimonadia bacterium]
MLIVAVLAIAAWLAWRYRAALLPASAPSPSATAPAAAALDVCAMSPAERIAAALGVPSVEARHVGAASDVPAAGACTFDFARGVRPGSVVALAFTRASLARGGSAIHSHDYYTSVVTGLEYEIKAVPNTLAGIGDEAAAAGFDGGAGPGQLVARRGDLVLQLVVRGADAEAAQRLARTLLAGR